MADQMLVQSSDQKPKLTIEQSLSRYVANSHLSDVFIVIFIVGDEREKIYAHRFILAIESKVFESMFYGELKETKYEIKVPDLTPVGFRNMMKYFYTKKIEEFDLSEMYETYMAANKYMASAFIRDLIDYVNSRLDVSNVCLIYDQLLKLKVDDRYTSEVRILIARRFSEACASNNFRQIDGNTLIAILKFNRLNVIEFDLLKACMRWTDSEILRQNSVSGVYQKSKRAEFESIKHLIRFGDIDRQHFSLIDGIQDYLTVEKIGSILLHQFQPSIPIQIDYRSPRGPLNVQVVKGIQTDVSETSSSVRELKCSIEVNKSVLVSSIQTFLNSKPKNLEFKVYKDEKALSLDCKIVPLQAGYPRAYRIYLNLLMEPETKYELQFSFSIDLLSNYNYGISYQNTLGISRAMTLKSEFEIEF